MEQTHLIVVGADTRLNASSFQGSIYSSISQDCQRCMNVRWTRWNTLFCGLNINVLLHLAICLFFPLCTSYHLTHSPPHTLLWGYIFRHGAYPELRLGLNPSQIQTSVSTHTAPLDRITSLNYSACVKVPLIFFGGKQLCFHLETIGNTILEFYYGL